MNESKIEKRLRQAPRPPAPADLLADLQAEITLPRQATDRPARREGRPWLQRWLPALSLGAFLLGGFIVLGVQAGMLGQLRSENARLRAALAELEPLRLANGEYRGLVAEAGEVERLRADGAEATRLRAEVAALRAQLPLIEKMRAENRQLQAAIQARALAASGSDADYVAKAREKADRIRCVNNLKQIGLAARIWSGDNNDVYPPDFLSMTNELSTPIILQCPGDKSRTVTNWEAVASGNISYQILAPGFRMANETNMNTVFAICPIHHSVGLVDGSVQQLSEERYASHVKVVDGRTVLVP